MDEIRDRIQRIYAAIGETLEEELRRFPAMKSVTDRWVFIRQDFTGGLTAPQISNIAFTAIHALAHLPHHLKRWARSNGKDIAEVDDTAANSSAISTLIDLSNRDKHGTPRDGGRSGEAPRIENLQRLMRLATGPERGSAVQVQFTPAGPVVRGSGSAAVVVSGDVLASDGTRIGDLHALLLEALAAWESLLGRWGLLAKKAV